MGRHFTLEEASALLPQVERELREALELKTAYEAAEAEIQTAANRIMMLGGAQVNRELMLAMRGRRDVSASRLKTALEALQALGCVVKDLDVGLLDFPTLYRGQEVYLCWKLGEPAIEFWHGVDEGFRGRKKIDPEFRANHQGDLPN